ncbi:EXS-domain-containing protein [Ramaria rubella]|nr:EXS-domain-containing protein [Ramaria rubella]
MDDDADTLAFRVEEVSSRAFTFVPLPWRVMLLTGAGILCWASNLHFLHLMGVDTAHVLEMHSHIKLRRPFTPAASHFDLTAFTSSGRLYPAVYKLFVTYTAWSLGSWLLFNALCRGDPEMMDQYKMIPQLCAIGILAILVCPFNVVCKSERELFLQGLYRCLFSPLNQPIYFADVVLADTFTSFAKVIGDLWISACMLSPWGSLRVLPVDEGWLQWMVPCLMSLPYAVRLRQCIIDFLSSPQYPDKQALFNAIKYSTAFPVIFLSAAQRLVVSELVAEKGSDVTKTPWHGEHQLFRLWLLAVAVNSGYSFWWDVTNDWGLSLFRSFASSEKTRSSSPSRPPPYQRPQSPPSTPSSHPKFQHSFPPDQLQAAWPAQHHYSRCLRPTLLFNDPVVYYVAISLNLVLRLTWSLKLSSHLHSVADLESGIFIMETLELIRRWMWMFFRIEWEAVKQGIGINN